MAKILVIDDDALVRNTVSRMLRCWGHETVVAEDGNRGVALFSATQPALVITDIIMPDKDGIETIRELNALCPKVKVIAMSGGGRIGNLDFLQIAARLGAAEIISKPFDPSHLRACVDRCLAPPPAAGLAAAQPGGAASPRSEGP